MQKYTTQYTTKKHPEHKNVAPLRTNWACRAPRKFWDNIGNSAPILTILLLLQADIYGA